MGKVWRGKMGRMEVWVRNDDDGDAVDIKYTVLREDVTVAGPETLDKDAMGVVIITWEPGAKMKLALHGEELIIQATIEVT